MPKVKQVKLICILPSVRLHDRGGGKGTYVWFKLLFKPRESLANLLPVVLTGSAAEKQAR